MPAKPYCILLTGMPNSGKSTIAYELVQKHLRNVLVIDGDRHREAQFLGETLGFSREDIMRNTDHVIKLAQFAQEQGFNVLIPQITPYIEQRQKIKRSLQGYLEIVVTCPASDRKQRPNFRDSELVYEHDLPSADIVLLTNTMSVSECAKQVLALL